MVATPKVKTVFSAERRQLSAIEALVEAGRYRSASEFLREAIDEKLERLRGSRLAEQVARYCAGGRAQEDLDLIGAQALDSED
jgi:Arc/MetJ-type ribon-helix-helix transcriptional regulator